jgi:hypothetical protein
MKDLLTSEDYKFGLTLTRKEYPKLSLNDIYVLIYDVRRQIEYAEFERNELKAIRQTELAGFKEKLSSGTKVKNIVVNTNLGPLTIYNYGGIYNNLFKTIKKIIPKYREDAEKDNKLFKYLSVEYPFRLIATTIRNTPLGPDQKRVVIGRLTVYFKLYTWKTENEHKISHVIGTYKQYLISVVKSKLKTISI